MGGTRLNVVGMITIGCVALGCGGSDDSGTAGMGGMGGSMAGAGGMTGGSGGSNGGTGGDPNGGNCDQTDPQGRSCSDADACTIQCDCSDFQLSIATCTGTCQNSPSDCADACDMQGGSYSGEYCFAGTEDSDGSGGSGGSGGSSGGETALGESCSQDSECASGMCRTVNDDSEQKCTKSCSFGGDECSELGASWDCAEISGGAEYYCTEWS